MPEVLEVSKAAAVEAYAAADPATKTLLEGLFGVDNLQPASITEAVDTFNDALTIFMAMTFTDPIYSDIKARAEGVLTAIDKLLIIGRVLQEDFVPDYGDPEQEKWLPSDFEYDSQELEYTFKSSSRESTAVSNSMGTRFAQASQELSDYFGNHFIDIWNLYLLQTSES